MLAPRCFLLLLLLVVFGAVTELAAGSVLAEFFSTDSSSTPLQNMGSSFPEDALNPQHNKIGMSLSGGGSRSFVCSIAVFKALFDLKLLPQIAYSSSVSGGSWANAVVSYFDETKMSMRELLGEYVPPHRLTLLRVHWPIPPKSARGFPVHTNMIVVLLQEIARSRLDDVWTKSIHRTFLQPAGISLRAMPTWSRYTASQVLGRNPSLLNELEFRFAGGEGGGKRPFPIINIAMLGPSEDPEVANVNKRQYAMFHATPLYVGFPRQQNLSYFNHVAPLRLGGMVEPVGFGGEISTAQCGLAECPLPSTKRVRRPSHFFSIANATAASSWAPGSLLVSYQHPAELLRLQTVLLTTQYFSPQHGGKSREVFVGDGENVENQGVIALLQRGARVIFMFVNSATPLTSTVYDSILLVKMGKHIDSSLASLFGFFEASQTNTEDYSRNQVFARRDLLRVMHALQSSARNGRGAVAALDLETVSNVWWGIPAKRKVRIVFNYLSRAFEWEQALPSEVRDLLSPWNDQRTDSLMINGTFKRFPHVPVSQLHISTPMANALSSLTTWVVRRNAQLYRNSAAALSTAREVSVD